MRFLDSKQRRKFYFLSLDLTIIIIRVDTRHNNFSHHIDV